MKKILGIIVLALLLSENAHSGSKWGKGDLQLSDFIVNKFIQYVKGNYSKTPHLFAVSNDGNYYNYYTCGSGRCSGGDEQILEECQRFANDTECSLFASRRTIKWKNDINPGKGKVSTIKSKWSDDEIRAKLTELGFVGGSSSATTTPKITKKVEKKKEPKKVQNEDIVQKLKDLKELLDTGALTEEEFVKAKKKLLN